MHHLIYKTRNLINGEFYIGIHSTEDPQDQYLGSGFRLKNSIQKYGKANFEREILGDYPSREAALQRESELVDRTLLEDPKCLNLILGGGSFRQYPTKTADSIWIKKDDTQLRINLAELGDYLLLGWSKGRSPAQNVAYGRKKQISTEVEEAIRQKYSSGVKHSELVAEYGISNAKVSTILQALPEEQRKQQATRNRKSREFSPETRQRLSVASAKQPKRVWMNDGTVTRRVLLIESEAWASKGWKPGRLGIPNPIGKHPHDGVLVR
jgi:hypothetical protein